MDTPTATLDPTAETPSYPLPLPPPASLTQPQPPNEPQAQPHVTATTETKPENLLEPFRQYMLRMLEKPLTMPSAGKTLRKLQRAAEIGQQACDLLSPKHRARNKRMPAGMGYICPPSAMDEWDDDDDDGQTLGMPQVFSVGANPSPNPILNQNPGGIYDRETFGATAIRELVTALKPQTRSVSEIVKAIAEARSLGLEDIATELTAQLRAEAKPPIDPAGAIGAVAKAIDVDNCCHPSLVGTTATGLAVGGP